MNVMDEVNGLYKKQVVPEFNVGDTVKVSVRIIEGEKDRLQMFEGVVIAINGRGFNRAFTVRKMSFGEGVERVFPLHSPRVESIEIVRRGDVRRAKLYYLRDKVGRKANRIKEKKTA